MHCRPGHSHLGMTPRHEAEVCGTRRAAANSEHFPPGFEVQVHALTTGEPPLNKCKEQVGARGDCQHHRVHGAGAAPWQEEEQPHQGWLRMMANSCRQSQLSPN